MSEQMILCPYCKKEFPLTDAISAPIRNKIRDEIASELSAQFEKEKRIFDAQKAEWEKTKSAIEKQLSDKMKRVEEEAKRRAKEEVESELKDLEEQVREKDEKLKKFMKEEMELRRKMRQVEEEKRELDLEVERKRDEIRREFDQQLARKIEEVKKLVSDEYQRKLSEKEKVLSDTRRELEEAKRKAEQGSQQVQGEVLEKELERLLKEQFPRDQVEKVPVGKRGGDILHLVCDELGRICGTIIWEAKRAKAWQNTWVQKLKDDQREVKADLAVIVTVVLPDGVNNFGLVEGVWVCNPLSVVSLATALRMQIIQVANAKVSQVDKSRKMEVLYDYLTSVEFEQRVKGIIEPLISMEEALEQEKRAMEAIWAKREKEIKRVRKSISGMYGDMKGIAGASLPEIESFELKALSSGE